LASFSTVSGTPILGSSSSFRGMPSTACRFGEKTTLFSCERMRPATARHAPPISNPSLTSTTARAMLSTRRSGEAGVG
jgi:hypothetical protein